MSAVTVLAALLVPGSATANPRDLAPGLSGRDAAETVVLARPAGCRGDFGDVVCFGEIRTV
ncbi:MAG: hypothetical protein ACJ72N_00320 [Labedaea sp.]